MPKLSVVVTASAPIAFDSLDGENLLSTALRTARSFSIETSLPNQLFVAAKDLTKVAEATKNLDFEFGVIDCDPSKPAELAKAVEALDFEIIALHDAQRPLTRSAQFHRTLEGLFGCDAVRPSMAFTETLKELNNQSILTQTIDRTKVRRISTPEIIRRSVIDFSGADSIWMLPLIAEARLSQVEADPESLRINSAEEKTLMEAFLHWQQKIAK
jgi:2-C-methyl-D-erythritol 4-phosphate cytidylyltransferase